MRTAPALLLGLVPLVGCAVAPTSPAAVDYSSEYRIRLSALYGQRSLDGDFSPVEDQALYGLEMDVRQPGQYVGFELSLFHSEDDTTQNLGGLEPVKFTGFQNEIALGGRWYYDDYWKGFEPYIGVGLSLLWSGYENKAAGGGFDDTAFSPALYVRGGLLKTFGNFAFGIEYRQSFFSQSKIGGEKADSDYQQLALVLGYAF